jgi:UDP-N-acetylmuramyl tripeptide synthase
LKTDVPAALPFEDSRRLTGANLFFGHPGAVLETVGLVVDDELLAGWRARVERARVHLGWSSALAVAARRHAAGASLALAAPADQLFTATEINEWALCATVRQQDATRWSGLESALVVDALEQASDPKQVIPPVLDEAAALERFERLAASERRPDVLALVAAADAHDLPHVVDDHDLTLGAGAGSRTWPIDALPSTADIPWGALHGIPVAAVTGSNGKTTTVRLVAACARDHGWTDGFCCTDGVFVANALVEPGDYSGPAGTRRILRDSRVQAAVLEIARGGILRRGLATDRADVAVVTNVSNDHFGEFGIDDLDGLADAKMAVARLVARRGVLVLNADDALLRAKASTASARLGVAPPLGWFSLDYDRPELLAHRALGGATCGVRAGRLLLGGREAEHDLGRVEDMPLTVGGTATYNVANLAGAALTSAALGIAPATIRAVYARFARDPADNAGRLMRFDVGGARIVVDYAHNPDGLRGVLHVAQRLRGPGGRLIMLLGHAGNRRDEDIAELAAVAAAHGPDLVVVKEDEGHLRGRQPGEVPEILRRALLSSGLPETAVVVEMSERAAASYAIAVARPGDAVALLVHSSGARAAVLAQLRSATDPPKP